MESNGTGNNSRSARSRHGGRSFEGMTVVTSKPRRGTKYVSIQKKFIEVTCLDDND